MGRKGHSRLACLLLGVALGWAGAELVVRICYPVINLRRVFRPGIYVVDPERGFALKPSFRGLYCNYFQDIPVRTNSLGLRDEEISPADSAASLRVLCLGDSNTFGIGVARHETFPARLQTLLRQTVPDARVFNAGVPGYGTAQERSTLDLLGATLEPHVITLGWLSNDIPGRPDAAFEVPLIIDGYLCDSPEDFERFSRKQLHRKTWERSRFLQLIDMASKLWQNRRKAPRRARATERQVVPRSQLDVNVAQVLEVEALARRLGARLLVVAYVTSPELRHGKPSPAVETFVELCRGEGLSVHSLWRPFWSAYQESTKPLFVLRDDGHPSARGHAVTAESVAPAILELVPRRDVVPSAVRTPAARGSGR